MVDQLLSLAPAERLPRILTLVEAGDALPDGLAPVLLATLEAGIGSGRERLRLAEVLGQLGDPRLRTPADDEYWVEIHRDDEGLLVARYQVTNAEFARFVEEGGYEDRSAWSDEGWEWLQGCDDPWPVRAAGDDAVSFVVPNQPVVGVSWYEAEAYARHHGARLLHFDERLWVVRGAEKRPYPWGSPFGEGNANTREEVLGRPCAVGLYTSDRTPDGIYDLAGNAAEWTADGVGGQRWIHPGAWDQPSMAAWAKARDLKDPGERWAGLGFRLARDLG